MPKYLKIATFLLGGIYGMLIFISLQLTVINSNLQRPVVTQQTIQKPVEIRTVIDNSWTGFVSYYSEDGCVGCNPNQIMANGEKFDEDAYTIAFNKLPLNTEVVVTNTETGQSVIATVTDRGGFESLGRIADLSKATMEIIEAKTDKTFISIKEYKRW